MSAAKHLMSRCQIAKDAAQQAEVQRLERELQQVKTLHKEDMVRCSGLQQTNRYALWMQLPMLASVAVSSGCSAVGHLIRKGRSC